MKLYHKNLKNNVVEISATKCKKPSLRSDHGNYWTYGTILINGITINAHIETTRGQYIYFQYNPYNEWFKFKMQSEIEAMFDNKEYDIDPFITNHEKLFTNIKDVK